MITVHLAKEGIVFTAQVTFIEDVARYYPEYEFLGVVETAEQIKPEPTGFWAWLKSKWRFEIR